ncbi:MAG TPA: nucleotidyltransferase domain-containing protein, partial [Candidatus Paceibacterota bacterium]|nr:nucleotidyltransferase domain-containing protein [Candidatus Paceibacterota bacterium]
MSRLQEIIEKLKNKDQVDSVFLTGSQGLEKRPHSDIDLVIILKENSEKISSLYTWVDNTFADIFFFDHSDLKKIETAKKLGANNMDGILVSWLEKATIQFDKSGKLTGLKSHIEELKKKVSI